jgi:hypothetical protein
MKAAWSIENKYALRKKFEAFAEARPREFASLFANLDRVLRHLNGGAKVGGFQMGYFRSEGEGVFRIGQTAVQHAKESRLYIFPNQSNQTIYILTVGTKDRQADDISEAKTIADQIKATLVEETKANQAGA